MNTQPLKKQHKEHKEKTKGFAYHSYANTPHKKKQCTKYHAWCVKKCMLLNLVCSKVNLISAPRHTWWIDSSATTHISVLMQHCLSYRKPIR